MGNAEHEAHHDEEEVGSAAAKRDAPDAGSLGTWPTARAPVRAGGRLTPRAALELQRTAGNRAVARLARGLAQPPVDPTAVRERLTPGKPLEPGVRDRLGRGFGEDFSAVKVHDSTADHGVVDELGAHAITVGEDIAFGAGKYVPGTALGDALIAHELAHVAQQRGAVVQRWSDDTAAAERDADQAALDVMAGRRARRRLRTGLALRRCTTSDTATMQAPAAVSASASPAAPPAAPAATPTVDPIHPAWVDVIPWADDKSQVSSVYDASGAPNVTYSDRDAKELEAKLKLEGKPVPKPPSKTNAGVQPTPPPATSSTPEQQAAEAAEAARRKAAVDTACTAIDSARASLPGWAFPGRLPMLDRYGGTWIGPSGYVAATDMAAPQPIPPKKKGDKPTPVPPTAQEQAAMDSAKGYKKFLDTVGSESADLPRPTAPGAEATPAQVTAYRDADAKWLATLKSRLFYEVSAKEGGTDSINVWDSQILTWGGGIGSTSGQASTAMFALASNTTVVDGKRVGGEVTKALHATGIAFAATSDPARKDWAVVDTTKKVIFRDNDAAFLLKADQRLLMLLSHISRGELPGLAPAASVISDTSPASANVSPKLQDAIRRAAYDVQEQYFLHKYATGTSAFDVQIKTLADKGWPMQAIHVVLHLQWWGVGDRSLRNFDHWDKFPGYTTFARDVITKHPYLKDKSTTLGKATLITGEYADHMVQYFLDKQDEVWEPLTDPVKAEDTADGEIYAELGIGWPPKRMHRKLKGTPAATSTAAPAPGTTTAPPAGAKP